MLRILLPILLTAFSTVSTSAETVHMQNPGQETIAPPESYGPRKLVDRIVAIVDSEVILASTIHKKLDPEGLVLKVSAYPLTAEAPPAEQALRDEINLQLVKRKIKELELSISEAQLDQQVDQIVAQSGSSLEGLKKYLASKGKTYESYREDIREHMLILQFQGRVLMPLVKGEQLREQSRFKKAGIDSANVLLHLRQILIQVKPDLSAAEQENRKQRADMIYERLQGGLPFVKAEEIYSDLNSAREGQPATEHYLKDLLPQIAEKVGDIDPAGSVRYTAPIRSPQGWHIFYVEKREVKGATQTPEEQHEEVNRLLQKQLQIWLEGELHKVKVEIKLS